MRPSKNSSSCWLKVRRCVRFGRPLRSTNEMPAGAIEQRRVTRESPPTSSDEDEDDDADADADADEDDDEVDSLASAPAPVPTPAARATPTATRATPTAAPKKGA
jgi:hypothetical protein